MITVVIPVGPDPVYKEFLTTAIESVREQTVPPSELLIIDDQAHLDAGPSKLATAHGRVIDRRVWQTPWLSGVAHSFNFGVALARNDLVFMLGSDDRLEPHCLEDCLRAYEANQGKAAYYWVDVQYSDGEQQRLACNAAMVHKDMWRSSGGFPVESAVGPCDTMLISILMTHGDAGVMVHVESDKPPYWYRRHDRTYSRVRGSKFGGVHGPIRDKVTELWQRPAWAERGAR